MKTAVSNPAIPCVGVFMNAPEVDVAVLLPVEVEDEVGLVKVAVVDPEWLEEAVPVEREEVAEEEPGRETTVFPWEGDTAPDGRPWSVTLWPLHAAWP